MLTVRVCLPQTIRKQQPFLVKYQGRVMPIVRIRRFDNRPPECRYYELEGAVSEKDLQYAFLRKWLEPVVIRVE